MKLEQIDRFQIQMFDYCVSLRHVALEQKAMIKQTQINEADIFCSFAQMSIFSCCFLCKRDKLETGVASLRTRHTNQLLYILIVHGLVF